MTLVLSVPTILLLVLLRKTTLMLVSPRNYKHSGGILILGICLQHYLFAVIVQSSCVAVASVVTRSTSLDELVQDLDTLQLSLDSEMKQLQMMREQLTSLSAGTSVDGTTGKGEDEEGEGSITKKTYLPLLKQILTGNTDLADAAEEELNNILVMTESIPRNDAVGAASFAWETVDRLAHVLYPYSYDTSDVDTLAMGCIAEDEETYLTKEVLSQLFHSTYQPLFQEQFLKVLNVNEGQAEDTANDVEVGSMDHPTNGNIFLKFAETELLPNIFMQQQKQQQLRMNDCRPVDKASFDRMLETAIESLYSPLTAEMPWLYSEQSLRKSVIESSQAAEGQLDHNTAKAVNLLAPISGYAYFISDESSNITTLANIMSTDTNLLQFLDSPLLYKILSLIDDAVESVSGYNPFVDHLIDTISTFGTDQAGDEGSIQGSLLRMMGSINLSKIQKSLKNCGSNNLFKRLVASTTNIQQQLSSYSSWVQNTWIFKTLTTNSKVHLSHRYDYPHSANNKIVIVGRGSNSIVMPICWKTTNFTLSFSLVQPAVLSAIQVVKVVTDESTMDAKHYHPIPSSIHIAAWEDSNSTSGTVSIVHDEGEKGTLNIPLTELSAAVSKVTVTFTGHTNTTVNRKDDVCIGGLALLGQLI
jgi:hypothetical protein